jgi:hypothetical protein
MLPTGVFECRVPAVNNGPVEVANITLAPGQHSSTIACMVEAQGLTDLRSTESSSLFQQSIPVVPRQRQGLINPLKGYASLHPAKAELEGNMLADSCVGRHFGGRSVCQSSTSGVLCEYFI